MKQDAANKVVIIHGFFMKAPIMWALHHWLEKEGFECLSISYATYRLTLAENVRRKLPKIKAFAAGDTVHFIGHSLGGLFIRHLRAQWPEGFTNSRVITMGTPHQGSAAAEYIQRKGWERLLLNNAFPVGLDGNVPPWPKEIPLLSIAGSKSYGVGQMLFQLYGDDVINDGTVAYQETLLPEAQASLLCYETHMTMLYSRNLIAPISRWLKLDI